MTTGMIVRVPFDSRCRDTEGEWHRHGGLKEAGAGALGTHGPVIGCTGGTAESAWGMHGPVIGCTGGTAESAWGTHGPVIGYTGGTAEGAWGTHGPVIGCTGSTAETYTAGAWHQEQQWLGRTVKYVACCLEFKVHPADIPCVLLL